ncbi:hypothetical protein Tco_0027158 [Tanacetum coccineum]
MDWGEVNPTHAYYNGSRTSKDNEDPGWNTSFKTRRTQKTTSAVEALWKTILRCYLYLLGTLASASSAATLIVNAVTTHSAYFQCNPDCAGREGISSLIKCTSAIRQLAYGVNASFLDEYMQISERSSRMSLDHFCQAVMEIYGPEFLRKPTITDVEKSISGITKKSTGLRMIRILRLYGLGVGSFCRYAP